MTIPVIFCVDVEPDPRLVDLERPGPWRGYEATYSFLGEWRARLKDATGSPVRFSWFLRMDPQVEAAYSSPAWPAEHYPEFLADLRQRGDEVGLHVHAYRWDGFAGTWVVDHGDPSWVDHCLDLAFDAFEREIRLPCRSFRFGDRFTSARAYARLESLGCRFELTPEPGHPPVKALDSREHSTGAIPDYRPFGHEPYEREGGLVVIPLSTAELPRDWFPDPVPARLKRRLRRALGLDERDWVPCETLHVGRPSRFSRFVIDHALETLERPYLCAAIRTSTVLDPARRAEMESTLGYLAHHARARDFAFATPGEAMGILS